MSAIGDWVEEGFEPKSPDDLLWLVSGGEYTVVHDPVRWDPSLRHALGIVDEYSARIVIGRIRLAGGQCPECLQRLPLWGTRTMRRNLDLFRWACDHCGWLRRQEDGTGRVMRKARIEHGITLPADLRDLDPPDGFISRVGWYARQARRLCVDLLPILALLAVIIAPWLAVVHWVCGPWGAG